MTTDPWTRALTPGAPIPHTAPTEHRTRPGHAVPRTLLPAPEGLTQPAVFDPALTQYPNAFRAGDPRFTDEREAHAWFRARRTALDLVLAAVAGTPLGSRLVLRGSVLMATWCGEEAREPGDLDFVAPEGWAFEGSEATALFPQIAAAAEAESASWPDSPVWIDAAGAVTEDIWTYDRVPGHRLLLPWTAPGTAGGTVQIDVVYDEPLAEPAVRTALTPLGDGPTSTLLTVTPGLSLAWKIVWLISDMHPQGKDLYDAVLLSELGPVDFDVLWAAFVLSGDVMLRPGGRWWLDEIHDCADVGWEHFQVEYPHVTCTVDAYHARLAAALEPVIARAEQDADLPPYERWVRWLTPLVDRVRATAPTEPARALGRLAGAGLPGAQAAVVVLREVLGPDTVTPEQALDRVLAADERWEAWRTHAELRARILAGLTP
ncbi:nucleotidyl transferase AbiEii/AbiGii toxin family protein [Streptomyces sp. SID5785]|uniref:nucleotidyl transferase AbiEii/AbiGii toxin family protein n=1 Tax=Streptomyces sp. SID5785 TaxID=2690309 RepID=UPI001361A601|nr:nucleotidyl transferase AbiEii/AbiGii toxin family protein [Streptomyces sp. SID5785]MZD08034.1 nucleotidyl transferase AbiEii/AbiGii toxin family protein [Streptomyces sp. SID5785]